MKIKISENKEQLNEFLSLLAGIAVGAFFGFIGRKFFGSASPQFATAGVQIDKASTEITSAVSNDPSPQAKSLARQIVESKQKLFQEIEEIKKQAEQVQTAAEMPEKPSIMIQKIVAEYRNNLENLIAGKKLQPKTMSIVKQARFKLRKSLETITNIDKIVLLSSKKQKDGLWMSVISKTKMSRVLQNDENWKKFISILFDKYMV